MGRYYLVICLDQEVPQDLSFFVSYFLFLFILHLHIHAISQSANHVVWGFQKLAIKHKSLYNLHRMMQKTSSELKFHRSKENA